MTSKIPVTAHESPLSSELLGGGTIVISQSTRITEVEAEALIDHRPKPEATDTRAEMEAQGLYRCSVDGQWLPRECFSPDIRKRNGLQSVCKEHKALAERQRAMMRDAQASHRNRYRMRKNK